MKKITYFVIGLIIVLAIAVNCDYFMRNTKLEHGESKNTWHEDSNSSKDILSQNTSKILENDDLNTDFNKNVSEILSKVNEAQNEIKYFNSETDIIVYDKDADIENIKVETLSDVDNTISFIRLKDLNLNTVPIEAYYIKDTLYKYSHEDNEWIVDENVNDVSIEYKDFTINVGFNISGLLDSDPKNLRINESLSNEKYIVLEDEDKVSYMLEETHLVTNMKETIWIERETYYVRRALLENHLFDEESKILLQEFVMDMKIKEINNQFEIKIPKEI